MEDYWDPHATQLLHDRLRSILGRPVESLYVNELTAPMDEARLLIYGGYKIPAVVPSLRLVVGSQPEIEIFEDLGLAKSCYFLEVDPYFRADWANKISGWANTVRWIPMDPTGNGAKPKIHTPQRFGDVGHDLESYVTLDLDVGLLVEVPCGVRIEMPPTMYAQIAARSSFSRKGIIVPGGIIDAGYRGPLFVQMLNLSEEVQPIGRGDRVGQILFHPILPIRLEEVNRFTYPTERNSDGFGSTGR